MAIGMITDEPIYPITSKITTTITFFLPMRTTSIRNPQIAWDCVVRPSRIRTERKECKSRYINFI